MAMRVTIDKAGRLVIPIQLRRQLGVTAGAQLEATAEGGRLVIEPTANAVTLVEEEGLLVAASPDPEAQLTDSDVLEAIDEQRRWPRS